MKEYDEGFSDACTLLNIEVDKILAVCYNDRRTKDSLLDVKGAIAKIRDLNDNRGDMQLQRT